MGRERTDVGDIDFTNDGNGEKCPLFSHIRKANPREYVHAKSHQHRIIRRAIPYGPEFDHDRRPEDEAKIDRGLLFVAYQADIGRQFEFIQTRWLGANTFPHPGDGNSGAAISPLTVPGPDPLTGWQTPGSPPGMRKIRYHKDGKQSPSGPTTSWTCTSRPS
jgi:deferrochelatase/peroxidase EfeB